MAEKDARIGYVLADKYEIISVKGRGGMSVVYIAKDRNLGMLWAVKEFKRSDDQEEEAVFKERLIKEAELLRRLDYPSLVRIVDIIEAEGTIFIVMDYVDGEDLKSIMKQQGHPMAEKDVIDWGIQLCEALDYLHTPLPAKNKKSVIYRDLKPENIMLKYDGSLRIVDFGIAREFNVNRNDETRALGTEGYAAPEQWDESIQTDTRADLYSLGVTLHYLVTGENPKKNLYHPRPIREYNPQLSEGLEYIIGKCTEYNREDRYANAREVLYDLEHYETLTNDYRTKQKRKLRTFAIMAALSAVLLVVGVAGFLLSDAEKQSTYDALVKKGEGITLVEGQKDEAKKAEKVELYEHAIAVDPSRKDPYEKILSAYLADLDFSTEEADSYYKILENNARPSCSPSDYASLCYDFANVYFNYSGNYAQASSWFSSAVDAGGLSEELAANAKTYRAICDFRTNLSSKEKLNTLDTSEPYVTYWNGLCEAFDSLEDASTTPHSKLKLAELIVDACSSQAYTLPFKNGGVSQGTLNERLDKVRDEVAALYGQIISGADRELYDYILLHCDGGADAQGNAVESAHSVVDRTYQNAGAAAKHDAAPVSQDENGGE